MATNFSRRQFIGSIFIIVAGGLAYYWGTSSRPAPEAYLAGELLVQGQKNAGRIVLLSSNADIKRRWTMPFPVHSVSLNNAQPWQTSAIEAEGHSMAVVDLRSHRKPEVITSPQSTSFSGHGLFSQDGTKLFVTAFANDTKEGYVLVYDTETAQLLEKQSSGGFMPHDLQYDSKNLTEIIVANAGFADNATNLTWLSDTQKIVKQAFSETTDSSVKGFLQSIDGDIYTLGLNSFGHYRRDFEKIKMAKWTSARKGEVLNAYYDPLNLKVWLTLPEDDSILVVDGRSLEIVKEFKAEKPGSILAVTPDRPELLMVSVSPQADGSGHQRSYNLRALAGTDEALDHPRKFYSTHATTLEVTLIEK